MRGLVLEGGGAKGAYQIGAWRAFRELGITFDGVVGTSIGALNGALIVQGDYERAFKIWYNMNPSVLINGDSELLNALVKLDFESRDFNRVLFGLRKVIDQKGLDISPLRALVSEVLDETLIRDSNMVYGFVTVSVTDRKPVANFKEDVPSGQLGEYLIASANLPVFQIDRIDGKLYIDGGFYDNLPVNMLLQKGFDEIVTVELKGIGIKQKWQADENQVKYIRIQPSENLGKVLEFSPERARINMAMGYYDTMRAYKNLKGQYYYIEATLDAPYYLKWLSRMNPIEVKKLADIMGLSGKSEHRHLFEDILPKFFRLLKLDSGADYRDLILGLLEHIAKDLKIDRYHLFKDSEFLSRILFEMKLKPELRKQHEEHIDKLPSMIKQTALFQTYIIDKLAYLLLDGLIIDNDKVEVREDGLHKSI